MNQRNPDDVARFQTEGYLGMSGESESKTNPGNLSNDGNSQQGAAGENPSLIDQQERKVEGQDCGKDNCENDKKPQVFHWNLLLTAAIAAAAIAQVVTSYWQWDATNKQWEVMILDQRPWLSLSQLTLDGLEEGKEMTFHIRVENTGKTPAFNVRSGAMLNVFIASTDKQNAKLPVNPPPGEMDQIIAPGKYADITIIPAKTLSHAEYIGVGNGDLWMVMVLKINYIDVSGKERLTRAAFLYDHKSKKLHVDYNFQAMQ